MGCNLPTGWKGDITIKLDIQRDIKGGRWFPRDWKIFGSTNSWSTVGWATQQLAGHSYEKFWPTALTFMSLLCYEFSI